MGCDIHSHAERKSDDGWIKVADEPFSNRNYALFGWLAGVRNYSAVAPISEPRGLPDDASPSVKADHEAWEGDAHSASWLSVQELLAVDYDREVEDRRVTRQLAPNFWTGAATAEVGGGSRMTLREFLGDEFFAGLQQMREAGAERVVFWFDN